jgi:antirestriction protein ArdC
MNENKKQKVEDIVITKVLEDIQKTGKLPWEKPWKALNYCNAITKHNYRGMNVLLLSLFGKDTEYVTFNQARAKKGQINKGAKSHLVVFFKPFEVKTGELKADGTDKTKQVRFLRYFRVFELKDTNLEELGKVKRVETKQIDFEPDQLAEKLIASAQVKTEYGTNQACYVPSKKEIRLPLPEQFRSIEEYYKTSFHELGHALGDELKQLDTASFGTETYSKEELVAEIFANFCVSYCNLDSDKAWNNSISYLQGWLHKLANEPKLIFSAASTAQKRFDLLLEKAGLKEKQETKPEEKPELVAA